jgi:hypothetical protein
VFAVIVAQLVTQSPYLELNGIACGPDVLNVPRPLWELYRICTAVAPDMVFTVPLPSTNAATLTSARREAFPAAARPPMPCLRPAPGGCNDRRRRHYDR